MSKIPQACCFLSAQNKAFPSAHQGWGWKNLKKQTCKVWLTVAKGRSSQVCTQYSPAQTCTGGDYRDTHKHCYHFQEGVEQRYHYYTAVIGRDHLHKCRDKTLYLCFIEVKRNGKFRWIDTHQSSILTPFPGRTQKTTEHTHIHTHARTVNGQHQAWACRWDRRWATQVNISPLPCSTKSFQQAVCLSSR